MHSLLIIAITGKMHLTFRDYRSYSSRDPKVLDLKSFPLPTTIPIRPII